MHSLYIQDACKKTINVSNLTILWHFSIELVVLMINKINCSEIKWISHNITIFPGSKIQLYKNYSENTYLW